jgi:hypothetical protein
VRPEGSPSVARSGQESLAQGLPWDWSLEISRRLGQRDLPQRGLRA